MTEPDRCFASNYLHLRSNMIPLQCFWQNQLELGRLKLWLTGVAIEMICIQWYIVLDVLSTYTSGVLSRRFLGGP